MRLASMYTDDSKKVNIIGIIPCRLSSERLPRKNLQKFNGQTLLERSLDYFIECPMINRVGVFTDDVRDLELLTIKEKYPEASFLSQPFDFCRLPYERLSDLYAAIKEKYYLDLETIFVTTTCDNPIKHKELDSIIQSFIESNLDEWTTVDYNGISMGALHIISNRALVTGEISGYLQTQSINGIDIHTQADLEMARIMCLK